MNRDPLETAAQSYRGFPIEAHLLIDSLTEVAQVLTDEPGRIRVWSAGAEQLLGHRRTAVRGRDIGQIFPEAARSVGDDRAQRVIARHLGRFEAAVYLLHANGEPIPVTVLVQPVMNEDHAVAGYAYLIQRDAIASVSPRAT